MQYQHMINRNMYL